MKNKICVYAICKNEMKFIDKWIESMSEADYIVVLDTGSTDGTFEKLQQDSRITAVKQQIINPWRFDVARNESMKLIPDDANICVCTDPDELFEPGWAKVLRTKWDDKLHYRAWYKYAWRHEADGSPSGCFTYDKIHSRHGWKWKYPVHEGIVPENDAEAFDHSRVLNVFEEVYLHHYQDKEKARSSYLSLLKVRVEENPDELQSRTHLIHDYLYNAEFDNCIKEIEYTIERFEKEMTPDFKAHLYLYMGDAYQGLEKDQEAIDAYQEGIQLAPQYAEPHIALAQVLMRHKKYIETIDVLKRCIGTATQYYVWFKRGVDCTEDTIYSILATAYALLGDWNLAYANIAKAYHLNPSHDVIAKNYQFISSKLFEPLGKIAANSIIR